MKIFRSLYETFPFNKVFFLKEQKLSCRVRSFPCSCVCAFGFHGTFCEVNVDDCEDHGCDDGATCVDGVGNYTCLCPPHYTGSSSDLTCGEHEGFWEVSASPAFLRSVLRGGGRCLLSRQKPLSASVHLCQQSCRPQVNTHSPHQHRWGTDDVTEPLFQVRVHPRLGGA